MQEGEASIEHMLSVVRSKVEISYLLGLIILGLKLSDSSLVTLSVSLRLS